MNFIPNTDSDREQMLKAIGLKNLKEMFVDVPEKIQLKSDLKIPSAMSEIELTRHMQGLASQNKLPELSFQGAGAYNHFVPAVVDRLISRSEFYTAYTPYQPEISQGILQAIFEYQTMMCELTGMEVANASTYDGASALAEAAIMCNRKTGRDQIIISKSVHPEYRETVKTYADANSMEIVEIGLADGHTDLEALKKAVSEKTAGVFVQSPNYFGIVEDLAQLSKVAKGNESAFVVTVVEPTSLGLLESPGKYGADIVVGEGQSFGNSVNYGGPYLGIVATNKDYMRLIPGRLSGMTVDNKGNKGYVLTLQAREQHIRREKASSNICTNQALCALAATVYLATIGKKLGDIAIQNYHKAHYAFNELTKLSNVKVVYKSDFYNEFVIKVDNATSVFDKAVKKGIVPGVLLEAHYPELKDCLLVNVTEVMTKEDIDKLVGVVQ